MLKRKIITTEDIAVGYFETGREPSRRAYLVKFTARFRGQIVTQTGRFLPEEYRVLGQEQVREAVVDALIVRLNKEETEKRKANEIFSHRWSWLCWFLPR